MKNGGLMEKNRQNEPNKLPIFGAHQWAQFVTKGKASKSVLKMVFHFWQVVLRF